VLVGAGKLRAVDMHDRVDQLEPRLERAIIGGGIKHQKADCSPQIRLVMPPNDANRTLEALTADPQLAIKRFKGQPCCEPGRRVKPVALP